MIEINRNRLIPAKTANWGEITGDISAQKDLMSTLSGYATSAYLSSYATESWVEAQGYLSSAGLDDYATKSWVSDQGYLTSETLPSDIATQSWVSSQQFATESWVSSQGYISSAVLDGYLMKSNTSGDVSMLLEPSIAYIYLASTIYAQTLFSPNMISMIGSSTFTQIRQGVLGTHDRSSHVVALNADTTFGEAYLLVKDGEDTLQVGCHNIYTDYSGVSSTIDITTLTTTSSFKTINSQSIVGEGDIEIGGLTPEQEEAIEPLENKTDGYLKYDLTTKPGIVGFVPCAGSDQYAQCWVFEMRGDVYLINWLNLDNIDAGCPYIYKWNRETWSFEVLTYDQNPVVMSGDIPEVGATTDNHVIWSPDNITYYFNNTHSVSLQDEYLVFTEISLGGTVQTYNGKKSNIFKLSDGNTYMIYRSSSTARGYKYDPNMQEFTGVTVSNGSYLSITNWYRYSFYYNGDLYFTTSQYYLISLTPTSTGIQVQRYTGAWPILKKTCYDAAGSRTLNVSGDRIRTVGGNIYFVYGEQIWRWDVTTSDWVVVSNFKKLEPLVYNTNGVEIGDLMFGFGYIETETQVCPVWNFTSGETEVTIESTYWDNTVDTRLTALEESVGTALEITNNILG